MSRMVGGIILWSKAAPSPRVAQQQRFNPTEASKEKTENGKQDALINPNSDSIG